MHKRFFRYAAMISAASLIIFAGNIAIAENSYTYTNCDKATLLNVSCDGSQIQMNDTATPFPFINVAASGRGTVVRVHTRTGEIIGEYLSAPYGQYRNPSRTTVDLYGNVWVGNRDEGSNYKGSVVKIGLIRGGTRCDKNGAENTNGEYLKPPFKYNTCIDRDGDGLIKTSRGLGDIRAWSNANWADSNGGVSTADDECICNYVRTNGTNVRHVSVDKNNNVWVGGYTNSYFDLLDGDTGAILATFNKGLSPYGGLIDSKGVLWSSIRASNGLLRYDPKGTNNTDDDTYQFFPTQDSYGMGIDSYGNIWLAQAFAHSIYKFHSDGTVYPGFPKNVLSIISWVNWFFWTYPVYSPGVARGVAVTPKDNHVWVAFSHGGNKVVRLDNDGNILKDIPVGAEPTGVAVDSDGKVWVCNYSSNNLMRINPVGGTDKLGEVDMTVDLGWGAAPYNYSDMTGTVVLGTAMQGTWSVIHDSGYSGTVWNTVSWNSGEPDGTRIKTEVRAANKESRLTSKTWTEVSNGAALNNLIGQYLEIRTNFIRDSDVKESPVLYDLTVTYPDPPPTPVLAVESPIIGYQSCYESITVSGTAYDKLGIAGLSVNGKPVTFTPTNNPDPEKPNEVSFNMNLSANIGSNNVSIAVTNTSGKTDSETRVVRVLPVIECACSPVLNVESPKAGYLSGDYYTCNESITVSGTAGDCEGVKNIIVNGSPVNFTPADNPDPDKPKEVSFSTPIYLNLEDNTVEVKVTNTFGKTAFVKRSVYRFEGGVFIAGDDGIVKFDWLYDGGAYHGEMGIFSLSNMETLIPNSAEFIREAARRALSNSEQGYVVISDRTEGARFSGFIGENQEWNSGEYKGLKSFKMKPGDTFATILVPNYTLQELFNDPATQDVQKRPLFSLASANPEHNLYVGQIADVNGMGKAFIYEDMNFVKSDKDYNDFIFQITGVVVCEGKTPTVDSLIKEGIMRPERDWRIFTQIGKEVVEHIEIPEITEDTMWVSVAAKPGANITVYDVNEKFVGKDGGQIPGATIETDENGNQTITIPELQIGDYRIVVQDTGSSGKGELEIKGFKGDTELSVQAFPFTFEQGQTLSAYLPVKNFLETGVLEIKDLKIPTLDGKPLIYDFDGDNDIDIADIMKVASKWNTKAGDADYDAFYDFNKDGLIGLLDIMMVVNSLN